MDNVYKTYKLKELVYKIGSGATPRGGGASYVNDGISLIRSQNILDFFFSYDGLAKINVIQAEKLKNVVVEPDDVLLNITGDSVARVCQVPISVLPARVNQHVAIIRTIKGKLHPCFLKYYLLSPNFKSHLLSLASVGGTRNALTKGMVEDLEIKLPRIEAQNSIVGILSSLDDKIELNIQMNKTLESIAQAIFKEWFVDFSFPGFDGELVDGMPKGWRKGRLGEDFAVIMGQSPPGESYNDIEEGTVFYQGRTDFGFRFPGNRMYTTAPNRMAKRLDTLVSVRAPVGDINMALEDCCIGRGLSAVRHISGGHSYTYYAMKSVENIFKGFEGEGTVFGSINKNNFENISMVIPKVRVIEQFEKHVNPIDEKILNNSIEIKTLTNFRDTLLPKLMTGKIRVA